MFLLDSSDGIGQTIGGGVTGFDSDGENLSFTTTIPCEVIRCPYLRRIVVTTKEVKNAVNFYLRYILDVFRQVSLQLLQ